MARYYLSMDGQVVIKAPLNVIIQQIQAIKRQQQNTRAVAKRPPE